MKTKSQFKKQARGRSRNGGCSFEEWVYLFSSDRRGAGGMAATTRSASGGKSET
jgi:hypothetical protein